MNETTYWKRQYEKFIKDRLCSRRNSILGQAQLIDDEIEALLDLQEKILGEKQDLALLYLLINDAFNQEDPIGLYPWSKNEYGHYVLQLVELYERTDEVGFRWQLARYIDEFWYNMFSNWPSKKALCRLERAIMDAVSQFEKLKKLRTKALEKAGKDR